MLSNHRSKTWLTHSVLNCTTRKQIYYTNSRERRDRSRLMKTSQHCHFLCLLGSWNVELKSVVNTLPLESNGKTHRGLVNQNRQINCWTLFLKKKVNSRLSMYWRLSEYRNIHSNHIYICSVRLAMTETSCYEISWKFYMCWWAVQTTFVLALLSSDDKRRKEPDMFWDMLVS